MSWGTLCTDSGAHELCPFPPTPSFYWDGVGGKGYPLY